MGIIITLRTNPNISFFRRYLLGMIDYPTINKLVLCSGYIQENLYSYSILQDELLNHLLNRNFKINVITVAGKFNNNKKWEKSYKDFINTLKSHKIPISSFIAKRKNWHAKIAIVLERGKPLAGIIGSSNLTRPAYGEPYKNFNFETDVVIFANRGIEKFIYENIPPNIGNTTYPESFYQIFTVLNPTFPQPDETERLKFLYNLIMERDELEPYS